MGELVDLDAHRPYITVFIEDGPEARAIVAPVAMFEKMASGELPILEVEGWEALVRVIIRDWIKRMKYEGEEES